jgi:DNA-binding IclR family transcriptional regulator
VENALDVLEALCDEGDEVRISRLSEKLGMNKTSVFRLLATFENRGYVERENGSGKYRLGLSAYEIGQKFLSRMGLLRKAKPIMERLVRDCNETAYLTVRRDQDVLFLDLVDTSQQVKIVSLIGRRYPLMSTSAGKVILANSSRQDQDVSEKDAFPGWAEERSHIHRRGSCADTGTLGEGITCVAVPLFRAGGELPGSLCLVGPDFRMPPERIEAEFLPHLKDAGDIISSKLGHIDPYLGKELF